MAGLGYKDFTAGAVLTAAQVDGYLMEQSVMNFAGTAERGSALSSVQSAGMMAHVGGGTVTVYDGTSWAQVYPAASDPGLAFIASAALSGSSVTISSCFSATYDVYRIVIERAYAAAGAPTIRARLRVSGTDATTNYQWQEALASNTAWTLSRSTSQNAFLLSTIKITEASTPITADVFSPFAAIATGFIVQANYQGAEALPSLYVIGGAHTTATSYDSITFLPSSSTFSGGTVRIYGYRNS